MTLKDKLEKLRDLYFKRYENKSLDEAGTAAFFIGPFIQALGYQTSNPESVYHEYPADPHDTKTGKVDFALLQNGKPVIFVEAKKLCEPLDPHFKQIRQYFTIAQEVNFAILTNGNEYRFYTDLVHKYLIDEKPFLIFKLNDENGIDQKAVEYIENFSRHKFDPAKLKSLAHEVSCGNKIYTFLKKQVSSPSEEFAKFISKELFRTTKKDTRDGVQKAIPDAFSKLIKSGIESSIPPKPPLPPEEQDIFGFDVTDLKNTKLDHFWFQGEVYPDGTWTTMFVFVLSKLSQIDSSKLKSAFANRKGFKIETDQTLIKHYCASIGNGLFISKCYDTPSKIQYLRIALTSFDMKKSLRIKYHKR